MTILKGNDYIEKLFNLEKKTIVLTGAVGLLGNQYSHALSKAGANVVLVDIDDKKGKKLQKILERKYHTDSMYLSVDITNQYHVKKLANHVLKKYGKIDGLINNAVFKSRENLSDSDVQFEKLPLPLWEKALLVNLTGVFLCCQEIGNIMVKQKKGVIVNISSIYGMIGADQRIYGNTHLNSPASYAATKGAVINLTRYLAAYWQNRNIRVNSLSLGGVKEETFHDKKFIKAYSERAMLRRMAREDEYNGALLFLISDASSYMTGANLVIDGGWTAW